MLYTVTPQFQEFILVVKHDFDENHYNTLPNWWPDEVSTILCL